MKRPLVNLLSVIAGDVGSRFIGFVISVYLARVLAPVGFGLVSLALAILGYLQLASSPGIQVLETRNAAAFSNVDGSRVNAVLSLRLMLTFGLWLLAGTTTVLFVHDVQTRDMILLFSMSALPFALMLDWFFQGKEAFVIVSVSRVIQYLVYGILVLVLVRNSGDVWWTPAAFSAGLIVAAMVLLLGYSKQWGSIRFTWDPALWGEILKKGLPVGAAMFLAQSATNLPPLVIGAFWTIGDVGLFSAAMKLVFGLLVIDRLFNALFLPVVTRYFSTQPDEVNKLIEVTLKIVSALVIPVAVACFIVGRDVIETFYGVEFMNAAPLFFVLVWYFALTVCNSVFVCVLIGAGRETGYTRQVTRGSITLCLATVAGTLLFGAMGASIGVVLGEGATLLLMMREASTVVRVPVMSIFMRHLVAGVFMAGVALFLRDQGLAVTAVLSLATFVVADVLLKGITSKEVQFMRERFV